VDVETRGVPLFHGDHRLIVGGESLFGVDSVDPRINGLSVVLEFCSSWAKFRFSI
jgi:hypothetical protein